MAKIKYAFQKKDFLYGGIILLFIGVVTFFLTLIGLSTDAFDPLGQAMSNFHISDGFFYTQAVKNSNASELNSGIILVDIKDCDSRLEIADIVNNINKSNPRLLAVDIIFGKTASIATESDSALISAFSNSTNLVLAQRVIKTPEGRTVERSFFADDVECTEGDVSFDYGIIRSFSPAVNNAPTFISQIAKLGGIANSFEEQLINYSPIKNIYLGPENLPATDLLKDQIVILGDSQDLRDFHDIPVLIDGQARTSGMNIIAQSLFTLRPGNSFTNCPKWLALFIGIILTYFFCTFIASPMFRIDKFNGLWISIWQVIVLFLLLVLTYFLFWGFHFNMTLTYWLIGVGLSELATEIFYFVKNKNKVQ